MTSPWSSRVAGHNQLLFAAKTRRCHTRQNGSLLHRFTVMVNSIHEVSARHYGVSGGCLVSARPHRPIHCFDVRLIRSRLLGAARIPRARRHACNCLSFILRVSGELSVHLFLPEPVAATRRRIPAGFADRERRRCRGSCRARERVSLQPGTGADERGAFASRATKSSADRAGTCRVIGRRDLWPALATG